MVIYIIIYTQYVVTLVIVVKSQTLNEPHKKRLALIFGAIQLRGPVSHEWVMILSWWLLSTPYGFHWFPQNEVITRPGKRLHSYGKSPCYWWENQLFLWPCSRAMLNFQRVYQNLSNCYHIIGTIMIIFLLICGSLPEFAPFAKHSNTSHSCWQENQSIWNNLDNSITLKCV